MKVPQLLLQYLLDHHSFRLEGLGTVRLEGSSEGFIGEKGEISIPAGSIIFDADTHAKADDDLILHIVQHTGKMRSLATSDVESYTETGKQLLNISKPFVLEQIGVLQKDAHGVLHFTQGEIVLEREENLRKKNRSLESGEESIHFDDNYKKPVARAGERPQLAGILIMVMLGIALLGWVSWYFYNKSARESVDRTEVHSPKAVEIQEPATELSGGKGQPTDTATHSTGTPEVKPLTDSSKAMPAGDFKVVILVTTKDRAQRRYDSLLKWGHQVVMSPLDSSRFELAIPIHAPLADSAHHRDSLSRFFGRKVWIETK